MSLGLSSATGNQSNIFLKNYGGLLFCHLKITLKKFFIASVENLVIKSAKAQYSINLIKSELRTLSKTYDGLFSRKWLPFIEKAAS